jgi:hypothetical protein
MIINTNDIVIKFTLEQAMKTQMICKVQLFSSLTSALDGGR